MKLLSYAAALIAASRAAEALRTPASLQPEKINTGPPPLDVRPTLAVHWIKGRPDRRLVTLWSDRDGRKLVIEAG